MAGDASRENGKKGGRPVSKATLMTQMGREMVAERLNESLPAIIAKAITQALEGDFRAREWLSDRAWGKAPENIDHTSGGKELPIPLLYAIHNNNGNAKDTEPEK